MTTIKIPFTKESIRQIPAKDLNAGTKGVELEVQTNFLVSQICSIDKAVGNPTDGSFEKISFVFKDDAEKAYYDALLDSKSQNFELSFDKDKVFLMVFGFGNFIDKTKPEVQVSPGHKSMVVFFESKFTGIITLETVWISVDKDHEFDRCTECGQVFKLKQAHFGPHGYE
ncbi:16668_t:CDS:2 [Entrophospora sp. SA101]|nr:16668_t:CDS:2 [Entrophospora sp. SA101]